MPIIWFKQPLSLQSLNERGKNTLAEHLNIVFTEVGDDYLKATMPVNNTTKQPFGLLHGGASAALAETLGSVAANQAIDNEKYVAVGLEINANHIKSARSGYVTGITTPIHLGSTTHVWDIKIVNEDQQLVCISRLTVAVLKRK